MKNLEDLSIGATLVTLAIVVIVLGITALIFFSEGYIRPNVLNLRREANQQSQQYIETTQSHLFQLKRKYKDLEADITRLSNDENNMQVVNGMKARQESLLDEMEVEALKIPEEEIPKTVKDLLLEEGKLQ